jgi:hypothetical protein
MHLVLNPDSPSFAAMHDLSLTFEFGRPRAWYIEGPRREAVSLGDWVGSVEQGGSVNFFNVQFNPHAHGTHTESVGHLTRETVHAIDLGIPSVMRARVLRIPTEALLTLEVLQQSSLNAGWRCKHPRLAANQSSGH